MKRELLTDAQAVLTDSVIMASFPKVELHRHLEGTFAIDTLHRIAVHNELDVPRSLGEFRRLVQFPADSEPDFLKFLSLFRNNWYRTLDDVSRIVHDSVLQLKSDGLHYLELRFSPEHFAQVNDFDRAVTTRTVIEAAQAAASEIGLVLRFLITFNRNKQEAGEMIDLYDRIASMDEPSIVGVDLAGDELNYPPELFVEFFDVVRSDGRYRSTIHAGEVTPAGQIWTAIDKLGASRIGHGVAAIHDEKLQAYLKDCGVALEQCITSNYQTGSWADEQSHPLGSLHRAGVPVTINSDDPTIQNALLTDDYVKAVRYFDLTVEDLITLNERALDAAFLDTATREAIRHSYAESVDAFREANSI